MPSISDYAMVRRQFYIFERALRKFKADVGLWVQYIELAKKERATGLVGRISARYCELLWIPYCNLQNLGHYNYIQTNRRYTYMQHNMNWRIRHLQRRVRYYSEGYD